MSTMAHIARPGSDSHSVGGRPTRLVRKFRSPNIG